MLDKKTQLHRLEQLKQAYYAGILRVRYGDTDMTYQSMSEMKKAMNQLEIELGVKTSKINLFTIDYEKGL